MGTAPEHDFLIIGAGFSGLAMAYRLRQQGQENFVILERADGLGGTWRDNSYPGCACDVPAHTYSLSYELNPDWSRLFAEQPELLAYLQNIARKHDLERHIQYNHNVAQMAFDEAAAMWRVTTSDGKLLTARYVVAASGPLASRLHLHAAGTGERVLQADGNRIAGTG